MQNKNKRFLLATCVALANLLSGGAHAQSSTGSSTNSASGSAVDNLTSYAKKTAASTMCRGTQFSTGNMDWNLAYPITVMGVPMGGGQDPPLMYETPICVCPGIFGIPSFGIGITYWEPLFISEVQRTPGCLSSLGGTQILEDYLALHGEHEDGADGNNSGTTTRMQVHWYTYPVFEMLDILAGMVCRTSSGFALADITEIDSTWQDDSWAAMYTPEATLFTGLIAQASCAVDAVASNLGFTVDPLFWCAGSWGPMFPLTGNSQPGNGPFLVNGQVQAKFMFRLARLGLLWTTIGPTATCFSHPNPILIKSQFRINQVAPVARTGVSPPPTIGTLGETLMPSTANAPGWESTDNMIWQGQQCCARTY